MTQSDLIGALSWQDWTLVAIFPTAIVLAGGAFVLAMRHEFKGHHGRHRRRW